MTPNQKRRFRRYVSGLRAAFPDAKVTTVRLVEREAGWGSGQCTAWTNGTHTIYIRNDLSYAETLDTLCHEWAHACSGCGGDALEQHNDEWGKWYARVYRALAGIGSDWATD